MLQEYLWSPRFGCALAKAPVKPTPRTGEPVQSNKMKSCHLNKTTHIQEQNVTTK